MIDIKSAKKRQRKRFLQGLLKTIEFTIFFLAVFIILENYVIVIRRVNGSSMENTLYNGQIVLGIRTKNVGKGDIVLFQNGDKTLVKRIIGEPGDTVNIDKQGHVFINGLEIYEPYVSNISLGNANVTFPLTLESDEYFVMGDNRTDSIDSRNTQIGNIHKDLIIGKIIGR